MADNTLPGTSEKGSYQLPPMSAELASFLGTSFPNDYPELKTPDPLNDLNKPKEIKELDDLLYNINTKGLDIAKDPFKGSKPLMGDFRNPLSQNQYIERYKAHGAFEKLGFSPFRDNEKLYNENSSWLSDLSRSAGQWTTLTWLGFKDAASFGELSDTNTAAEYQKAMSIGSSSRGGIGGFTSNLFLNSGYTVGIMGELAVEEVLMALGETAFTAAAPLTGGTSLAGTAALGGTMVSRATTAGNKIKTALKMGKQLTEMLENMRDINKVRQMFTKSGASLLNFLNPLENTVDIIKNTDRLKNLSTLNQVYRGVGAAYRDLRAVRLAYGEGALEGGMVQNEMEQNLIKEFRDKNGRLPNDEEVKRISETALRAGTTTSLINMPLIFFSNKLTLDGLISKGIRRTGSNLFNTHGGKILFNAKKTGNVYTAMEKNYLRRQLQIIKNPKLFLTQGGKYFGANFAEGFQEIGQEVVSGASEDYYSARYRGDANRGGYMSYVASNLKKQLSGQGIETFLSGFLMGGLTAPVSRTVGAAINGKQTVSELKTRIFDNANWKTKQAERKESLQKDLDKLNAFYSDPMKYLSSDLEMIGPLNGYRAVGQEAAEQGDLKTYYDMKDSSAIEYVLTALKHGRLGDFVNQLQDMTKLSEEEVKEISDLSFDKYTNELSKAIEYAKKIETLWEKANTKFRNPFDPGKYAKDSVQYREEAYKYLAWQDSISEIVFNQASFAKAIERQNSILSNIQKVVDLEHVSINDVNILFDEKALFREIGTLQLELDGDLMTETAGLRGVSFKSDSLKQIIREKETKLNSLISFEKSLRIIKEKLTSQEEISEENYKRIKDDFFNYITFLSENTKDHVKKDSVEEALKSLLDHVILTSRTEKLNDAINLFSSPDNFFSAFDRMTEVKKILHENRKKEIAKSLEEYKTLVEDNEMLNELLDMGIFFEPSELAALKESGRVPDKATFHYTDLENNNEVVIGSSDYNKALDILKKRIAVLHNLDINNEEDSYYLSKSRNKDQNDVRTHADLAIQYGFTIGETSELLLKDILTKIINSGFASVREKALAEELLKKADPEEKIVFTNLDKPGEYDATTGINKVDPRYNSHDYKQGKAGSPIEHSILHQAVIKILAKTSETESFFTEEIEKIRKRALEVFRKSSPQLQETSTLPSVFLMTGLSSTPQFIAAVMSDEAFQNFLSTVEYSETFGEKNAWSKFVDLVLETIKDFLGVPVNGTALNAALDLITSQVEGVFDVAKIEASGSTGTGIEKISHKTPIKVLLAEHPKLAEDVLVFFKEENDKRKKEGTDLLLDNMENLTDSEILNSRGFAAYFLNPKWIKKEQAIVRYNQANITEVIPETESPKPAQKSEPQPSNKVEQKNESVTVEDIIKENDMNVEQSNAGLFFVYSNGHSAKIVKTEEEGKKAMVQMATLLKSTILNEPIELNDFATIEGTEINGRKYELTSLNKELVIVVNINSVRVPFYLSSDSKPGWYPMFGYSNTGWVNKRKMEDVHNYYEDYIPANAVAALKEVSGLLNKKYGTLSKPYENLSGLLNYQEIITGVNQTLPFVPGESAANNPDVNATEEYKKVMSNIKMLGEQLSQVVKPVEEVESAEKVEPAKEVEPVKLPDVVAAPLDEKEEKTLGEEKDVVNKPKASRAPKQPLMSKITNVIDKVSNHKEWVAAKEKVEILISKNLKEKVDGQVLEELFAKKLKEVAFAAIYEDIVVGESVLYKPENEYFSTPATVLEKKNNTVVIEELETGNKIKVKKKDVSAQIVRNSEALQEMDTETPSEISPENVALSKETIETVEDINEGQAVKEDILRAESLTTEDLDDDLLNAICK